MGKSHAGTLWQMLKTLVTAGIAGLDSDRGGVCGKAVGELHFRSCCDIEVGAHRGEL